MDACRQLMDRDLLGTRRLAVVRDDFDCSQVRHGRGRVLGAGATRTGRAGVCCVLAPCRCHAVAPTLKPPPPARTAPATPPNPPVHPPHPQDRMHLDCVFSPLGGRCCIMLEDIMVGG
jgi:hypothetical protein